VKQHEGHEDSIHAVVLKGEVSGVHDCAVGPVGREGQHSVRTIHPDDKSARKCRAQVRQQRADPTSHIENSLHRRTGKLADETPPCLAQDRSPEVAVRAGLTVVPIGQALCEVVVRNGQPSIQLIQLEVTRRYPSSL
jgi:hypothetical protein